MTEKEHPPEPQFYLAILLFEAQLNTEDHQPLYEECFTLVRATSDEEARIRALQIHQSPNSYLNEYGDMVSWTLKHLVDVRPLLYGNNFKDGIDLYARHFRNYKAYCQFEPLLSDTI